MGGQYHFPQSLFLIRGRITDRESDRGLELLLYLGGAQGAAPEGEFIDPALKGLNVTQTKVTTWFAEADVASEKGSPLEAA
jgi:hypothetical protein